MKIKTLQQFKQAAFNGAYRGLKHQKFRRASNSEYGCVWTTADNRHCAIGWLIPGVREMPRNSAGEVFGTYLRAVERQLLAKPLQEFLNTQKGIILTDAKLFLGDLQNAHDSSPYTSWMRANLRSIAREHNLTIPDET